MSEIMSERNYTHVQTLLLEIKAIPFAAAGIAPLNWQSGKSLPSSITAIPALSV